MQQFIWNSLPSHIGLCNSVSTYKCHLKTHLYNLTQLPYSHKRLCISGLPGAL